MCTPLESTKLVLNRYCLLRKKKKICTSLITTSFVEITFVSVNMSEIKKTNLKVKEIRKYEKTNKLTLILL